MSSPDVALPIIPRQGELSSGGGNRLIQVLNRYRPYQGWSTFIFLYLMLWVLAESVMNAGWVEKLGLSGVVFWAVLAGLVLSKVRLHALLLHPLGIALGFLVVVWRAGELVTEETGWARLPNMWSRLEVWYEAATNEGLSTDLLPFAIGLLVFAWTVGYLGSWFVFRSSNPWVAVVLGGVAILKVWPRDSSCSYSSPCCSSCG